MARDRSSAAEKGRRAKAAKLARWKKAHPSTNRGYKFRLYPTEEQSLALAGQTHLSRALWNNIHAWWVETNTPEHRITKGELDAFVRRQRKDIEWLGGFPAQASQAVAKSYWQAWERCWAKTAGVPNFHAMSTTRPSFDIPQSHNLTKVSDKFSTVQVPKVGAVRYRSHRPLPVGSRVTGARVTYDAGRWNLVLRVEVLKPKAAQSNLELRPVVGFDRGVATPLFGSDGSTYKHGGWMTENEQRRLLKLERQGARQRHARWDRLGKKTRPGANEKKTYDQIARLQAKAARRRYDWQHKVALQIAQSYGVAVFEDLKVGNMVASAAGTVEEPGKNVRQKADLNRSIQNEAWSQLLNLISYKIEWCGGVVVTVPAHNTSKTCHACGNLEEGQRESQALFTCKNQACAWSGNADYNAACNILKRAMDSGLVVVSPDGTSWVTPASSTHRGSTTGDRGVAEGTSLEASRKRENRRPNGSVAA